MTSLQALGALGLPGIRHRGRCMRKSQGRRSLYRAEVSRRRLVGAWRGFCSMTCIVLSRPGRLSALVLLVALITAASSTLIVQGAQPEACVMTHHECDQTARVTDCCCLAGDASHQGGPIESRVQLAVDLSPHPVGLLAGTFADTTRNSLQIQTLPPSVSPPDFTTRSAPLLV